nr:SDR family oxidoreductase [Streptomyces sp. SID12488]
MCGPAPNHRRSPRATGRATASSSGGTSITVSRADVRVNAVSPGFTDTDLNTGLFTASQIRERAEAAPLDRIDDPAGVTDEVVFLLDAASDVVTGQNLQVDGGCHVQ